MSELTRKLAPGQRAEVHVFNLETGRDRVIYSTASVLFEAPNWARNGNLYLNGDGLLWSLPTSGGSEPQHIEIPGIPHLNNDHVLAPDHQHIYMSTFDDFQIYKAPVVGGAPVRVTDPATGYLHFLHGVDKADNRLTYVSLSLLPDGSISPGYIRLIDQAEGTDTTLTAYGRQDDGPEFSINDEWIYLNSEKFTTELGHAQISRMRSDGSELTRLTFDDRVNWFPHTSPDGEKWVYLSYEPGTTGHPADRTVQLRLVEGEDWAKPKVLAELPGGQGTINVNSWSPDSTEFAYVSYPFDLSPDKR